ncbi:hypothetical protein [Cereibacter sphaeroides]|nr:hypothetical protein [Cereibacter sphaeroides]
MSNFFEAGRLARDLGGAKPCPSLACAPRREQGFRRVNGVPRLDLACLPDAIFAAIQFCGIANRLAGQSPSNVFTTAGREQF